MGHHAGLADRGEDARIAHQEGQDRLHLLWRRLQLRCLDQDRNILKIVQVHRNTNQISTCVKGKFGWDFVDHADHLQRPLIREGTGFRESEWDEALGLIATKLSGIKQQSGPDAIAVIISSKTTVDYSPLGSASNGGCGPKRLFEAACGQAWSLDSEGIDGASILNIWSIKGAAALYTRWRSGRPCARGRKVPRHILFLALR